MAVLRNLRLMLASGVDPKLIRERLDKGVARALPFRFVTAARHAPKPRGRAWKRPCSRALPHSSSLRIDRTRSRRFRLDELQALEEGRTTRMDAAAGLLSCFVRKAEEFSIATFSDACVELPPRRGFALRDGHRGLGRRTRDIPQSAR